MVYIRLQKARDEVMKHWEKIKYRRGEWKAFWYSHVPEQLKTPAPGKFAIYSNDGGSFYADPHENPSFAHMIVEVGKPERNNDEYIKMIHEEKILYIPFAQLDSWLYSSVTNKLAGKNIAITGVTTFPRDVYVSLINMNGGTYKSGVGKKTTHLVNTHSEESSKIKRAKEYRVQLITEADFFKMIA